MHCPQHQILIDNPQQNPSRTHSAASVASSLTDSPWRVDSSRWSESKSVRDSVPLLPGDITPPLFGKRADGPPRGGIFAHRRGQPFVRTETLLLGATGLSCSRFPVNRWVRRNARASRVRAWPRTAAGRCRLLEEKDGLTIDSDEEVVAMRREGRLPQSCGLQEGVKLFRAGISCHLSVRLDRSCAHPVATRRTPRKKAATPSESHAARVLPGR